MPLEDFMPSHPDRRPLPPGSIAGSPMAARESDADGRRSRSTGRQAAIVALAVMASALAVPAARAAEKLEVALNWVAGGDHAPLYYAKKMGWYDKAGIDLDLQAGKGSVGSVQRVSVGNAQLGLADMAVVLSGVGKGANVTAIFDIYANTALGMYWLRSSGIGGLKDFAGKRIGVPAGDAQRALWPALAKINGIDPGTVTWVNIDPNGKLAGLKSRAIDVTTNFYNLHKIMSRELGADMGYLSWKKAGVNPYGLVIIANRDLLANKRDVVAQFTRITQRAYFECARNPQPCVDALVGAVSGLNAEDQMVNWQLTTVLMSDEVSRSVALGWLDPQRMEADYGLVKTYLGLDKDFDVKTSYTNDFLDTSIKMIDVKEP
jgi:NitT/TauT family transport system substrate-binding protein